MSAVSGAAASACSLKKNDDYTSSLRSRDRHVQLVPRSVPLKQRAGAFRVAASAVTPAVNTPAAAVEKVKLGGSELEVPILGIGAWAWGDTFYWNNFDWNDKKVREAKQAFDAACDSGLNFFDTAEVYGSSQFGGENSESLLGRFIHERAAAKADGGEAAPVVATKFAALPWRLGRPAVVAALTDSLARLGLKSVDLYQLHWPGVWGNEGYIDGLADCVERGLVKAVGVSNYKVERLKAAHAQLAKRGIPLASNQIHYNLLYRIPEQNGVKAACEDLGVSIIAYSPIAQGILSGKYTPDSPPSGPRSASYSKQFLTQIQPVLKRMGELGEKYGGKSKIQVALNWLLVQGNIVPIPGARNREQATEFAGALGWSLAPEEVEELRALASPIRPIQGFPAEKF
eukprot:TRINITY_DN3636_c0_g1_i2.p1 TRINITY_DN3636_c0_g1~~TRINITY_DN3636_c0_g1_i2.p1  ORF type:complete len:443 (-),score=102.77 TRINITY_DN3636_c0_g1_i2:322-1521(-)